MIFQNKKFILNGILFFSIISLSFAYFVQYILGHKPCNLCLIERYPYLGAIIFISIFFIINKYEKIFLFIILLFFIFGSVISIYHVGIEFGFFSESSVRNCSLHISHWKQFSPIELPSVFSTT